MFMTTRVVTIEGGQAYCPEAGLVDLERCLTCRRFRALVESNDLAEATAVECFPVRAGLSATWSSYVDVAGHLPG